MVSASDTVLSLKKKVEERTDIPPEHQRLIVNGKQLEDDRTLNDYGIEAEVNVHLGEMMPTQLPPRVLTLIHCSRQVEGGSLAFQDTNGMFSFTPQLSSPIQCPVHLQYILRLGLMCRLRLLSAGFPACFLLTTSHNAWLNFARYPSCSIDSVLVSSTLQKA